MIVSRERAESVVDKVQDELGARAPSELVNSLVANGGLRDALLAFRDGAVDGLSGEPDPSMLERRLLVLKRAVADADPQNSHALEELLARAVQSVLSVARGG